VLNGGRGRVDGGGDARSVNSWLHGCILDRICFRNYIFNI
jgi:hypothetical protein